jgi:hypothetical protein
MSIERQDRIALGIALLVAVGSVTWFGSRALLKADRGLVAFAGPTAAKPPALTQEAAPQATVRLWERPPSQSAGANWVYEVFTPPEIEHDERRGTFSARTSAGSSSTAVAHEADVIDFGLKLLAVARAPFRLQLVGHVGGPDRCQGIFEDQLTGRTLLACAGQQTGELDYVVESMAVERLPLSSEHAGTVRPVAKAVIRDARSGERVELSDQWPTLTDAAVATVSLAGEDGAPRVVRAGDEVVSEDAVFRIGKIQLAPPSLEATKVSSRSPSSESCVLLAPTTEFAGLAQPTL